MSAVTAPASSAGGTGGTGGTGGEPRSGRRRRRALVASGLVGLVAVGLVAVLSTRSAAPGTVTTSSLGGKAAPPVAGRNLRTGGRVSLRAERGRYVLVDFFASWCAACQSEAPALEQFLFSHRSAHDVAVIGVDSTTDTKGDAVAFLDRTGATFAAISDPGGQIANDYGVASPPQSYLVGPNGKVLHRIVGGVTAATLDRLVPVPGKRP